MVSHTASGLIRLHCEEVKKMKFRYITIEREYGS